MNKLVKLIESLESNYNVSIEEVLKDYGDKLSVQEMAAKHNVSHYIMTLILQHLQLKRCKNKRDECIKEHYAMLNNESIDTFTEELEDTNEFLEKKCTRLENTVSRLQKELSLKRKQVRLNDDRQPIEIAVLEAFNEYINTAPLKNYKVDARIVNTGIIENQEGLVLVLSDEHIGEVVGKDVPNNKYDYKTARKRLDLVLDKVLTFPKQSREICVLQCGDLIRGLIHDGLTQTEGSFIESIIQAVDLHVYLYSVLSEVYTKVNIVSITGNHDRTTEDIKAHQKALDFTRLIDSMVARQLTALGKTNISLDVTHIPYGLVTINNANIFVLHGDTVRKYSPSDVGQRSLLQDICLSTFKEPYRHCVSGHTHQFQAVHNQYDGMSISNGTLVGSNNYGITNGLRDIHASQTIFFIEQSGEIEFVQAIKL